MKYMSTKEYILILLRLEMFENAAEEIELGLRFGEISKHDAERFGKDIPGWEKWLPNLLARKSERTI